MLKKLLVLALVVGELNVSIAHILGRQEHDHGGQTLGVIDNMVGFMTNAVSVLPQMLDLTGQIITGPPPPPPTAEPEPQPPTAEPEPQPPAQDSRVERMDMHVARDPSWTGQMVEIPPYTDDYDTILERLRTIGASITKVDFEEIWEERGLSQELWDTFKGDRGPFIEDYVEAGIFTGNYEDYVAQHIIPANRWPAFGPDEAVMNNTLTALDDCEAVEFSTPFCFNPAFANLTDEERFGSASAWYALHVNFYQGDVCNGNPPGLVDPTVMPVAVEVRFVYPMIQQGLVGEKPMYHFFYYGNGLFAKIRLWVGDTVGWEASYSGGWPHGTVPHGITFGGYTAAMFQMPGVNERQIAWYNVADPNTEATSDAFYEEFSKTGMANPDLTFSLGRNPWVGPNMMNLRDFHMSVYGDDEPACYFGDPRLCTPNPLYPEMPLVFRPLPQS